MNRFNLPKVVGVGIVAVGLTLMPLTLPAIAQDSPEQTESTEQGDRDFDWGWLGLLGLAGLAGLRKQDSREYR